MDFSKKVSKVTDFRQQFGAKILRFFLFRISSQIWRFSQKLRFSFLKGFQAKKGLVLHVLCPSHPCASLARTVLKPLSFFLDSGGERRVRLFKVNLRQRKELEVRLPKVNCESEKSEKSEKVKKSDPFLVLYFS